MNIDALSLDGENPRHPLTYDQHDAIAALLDDGLEKINNLAKDIAEYGLSPAELLIVMPHEQGRYIVLEGNRRIAALKILRQPDLAEGHSSSSRFNWIKAEHATFVDKVPCAVVSSREEARHWLELRHTGEREGAGVVPWSTSAKQRFSPRSGTHTDKAMKVIDVLRSSYSDDTELLEDLKVVSIEKSTTLGRLVSDPDVRSILGINLKKEIIERNYLPLIRCVVSDLVRKISVSDIKSKEQRKQYIEDVRDRLFDENVSPSMQPTEPQKRSNKRKKKATNQAFLFDGLELNNLGEKVSAIVKELQRLDIEKFPHASSVLLRCIIELSVDQFYQKKGWEHIQLQRGVRRCLDEIDPSRKDDKYVYIRKSLSGQDSLLTPSTLHGYVHSQYVHPSPTDLRAYARNYHPFLAALNGCI